MIQGKDSWSERSTVLEHKHSGDGGSVDINKNSPARKRQNRHTNTIFLPASWQEQLLIPALTKDKGNENS
jgi:hypothetical protein